MSFVDFWGDKRNRIAFFEDIAQELSFNPLVPDNWYSLKDDVIMSFKVFNFCSVLLFSFLFFTLLLFSFFLFVLFYIPLIN